MRRIAGPGSMGRALALATAGFLLLAAPVHAAPADPCANATVSVAPGGSRALMPCDPRTVVDIRRAPEHGRLDPQVLPNGSMRYTPEPGFHGVDSFTFRSPQSPPTAPDSVMTVHVTSGNLAPVCAARVIRAPRDSYGAPHRQCTDPDEGDSMHVEVVEPPQHGKLADGLPSIYYQPDKGYEGPDRFVVRVGDGTALSAPQTFDVAVIDPGPTTCASRTLIVRRDASRPLPVTCEADAVPVLGVWGIDFIGGLEHGALRQSRFSGSDDLYVPNDGFTGADQVTSRARTSNGAVSEPFTLTLQVDQQGNAPECSFPPGRINVRAGRTVETPVWCSDPDGDAIDTTLAEGPYRGGVTAAGAYTADVGYTGPDRFTLRASDHLLSTTSLRRVRIFGAEENTAPWCLPHPQMSDVVESRMLTRCHDDEGDPLTYEFVDQPAHGTVSWSLWLVGFRLIDYQRESGHAGADAFSYRVRDGRGGVSPVMRARVAPLPPRLAPAPPSCTAWTTERIRPGATYRYWPNCYDHAGSQVVPTVIDGPDHGTLTPSDNGTFTYQPAAGYTGRDEMTLRASNEAGHTDVTLDFEISPDANHAPYCLPTQLTVTRGPVSIAAECLDPVDGDVLTFTATAPDHGTLAHSSGSPSATYTPAPDFSGVDTVTFTADDGHGGKATTKLILDVRGAGENTRPRCQRQQVSTPANTLLWLPGLCQDHDGDPLAVDVTSPPGHGTYTASGAGGTYMPDQDFTGADSFELTVDDGRAPPVPVRIDITVGAPPLQGPYCRGLAANVLPSQPRPLSLSCYGQAVPVEIVGQPAHGTVSEAAADGTVIYTPNSGYRGTDAFTYRYAGNPPNVAPATVTLNVRDPLPLPGDLADLPSYGPTRKPGEPAPPAPEAPPVVVQPPITVPSLRDLALQAMGGPLRTVIAKLGGAEAFLRARPPKVGGRPVKLFAVACPTACIARVSARLVAGRRSATLPARTLRLGENRAGAFAFKTSRAIRRKLGNPRRAVLVLTLRVQAEGARAYRTQIRLRVRLR